MSKFKRGDKVILLRDIGDCKKGQEFEVVRTQLDHIHCKGFINTFFKEKNLVLKEKIKLKTHSDQVNHPKHYQFFDTEAIEIIRQSLTDEEWLGYCKGNALKYRLRAGGKDEVNQEISKAKKYEELYEKYKDGVN